jgi:hypothetical protein
MEGADFAVMMLVLLGALHGVNPGMGWLFAVSLGMQEQRRAAVIAALGALALGHALAVGTVLVAAAALGLVLPVRLLKWIAAASLLGFGAFHLLRHRHPRWGGMRVGVRDLTIWSFFMASAHGAGLMALPFVLGSDDPAGSAEPVAHDAHAAHAAHAHGGHVALTGLAAGDALGLLATLIHTAAYLAVAGILALVVYEKLGLRLLRTAWINLNAIWAAALIVTAALILLL